MLSSFTNVVFLGNAEEIQARQLAKKKLVGNVLIPAILAKDLMLFKASLDEIGTDANIHDDDGLTPLHYGAALGARPFIRLLVASRKCDYLIRDNQGRYASDIAVWTGDYAVARLLAKHQLRQACERDVPAWEPRSTLKLRDEPAP